MSGGKRGFVLARVVSLVVGAVLCVIVVHFPMVRSGFRLTQADLLDSRFNHYLLEHSYRWLVGTPGHESLWSPTFCYPAGNMLAHSDVMVSFAPPYWAARAVGLEADTAFQVWMVVVTVANFLLAHLVLRRGMGIGTAGAWCGAVLFAIASSRVAQLGHQQLYCQAYVLLAFYGVCRVFRPLGADLRGHPQSPGRQRADTGVRPYGITLVAIVLQFWGGFYMGFFLALGTLLAIGWAIILPPTRSLLVARTRVLSRKPTAWVILAVASAAMIPLFRHYWFVAQTAAVPDDRAVLAMLPVAKSWVFMGAESVVYWRTNRFYADVPAPFEQAIGIGLVTTVLAVLGLWRARREPAFLLLLLTSLTLIVLCTRMGGHFSLWWGVRRIVPGAVAVRAVARMGLILVIPAAIGLGLFVERLGELKISRVVVAGLVCVCFLEQLRFSPTYDKYAMRREVRALAERIPPGSKAFFFTGNDRDRWAVDQVDAMWASLQKGVPTVNGYSGTWPPAVRKLIMSDTLDHRPEIEKELKRLRESSGLSIDWIVRESDRGGAVVRIE